jgi:hypothetical protein
LIMDRSVIKDWFAAQAAPFKILILLEVASELTVVLRVISTEQSKDELLKSYWVISECQNRLLDYVTAVMAEQEHYPDDVIIRILFDHLEHPTLRPYTQHVWDKAVQQAEKFGSHLRN